MNILHLLQSSVFYLFHFFTLEINLRPLLTLIPPAFKTKHIKLSSATFDTLNRDRDNIIIKYLALLSQNNTKMSKR